MNGTTTTRLLAGDVAGVQGDGISATGAAGTPAPDRARGITGTVTGVTFAMVVG